MTRELNRLMTMILLAFGVVAITTLYWAILEREHLFARDDNPRKVLAELNVQRGQIVDRGGEILAYSQPAANPALGAQRIYPHPQVVSAVGHYSYQYGVAGIEEAYDALLRGDGYRALTTELSDDLLNREIIGGDVQSTVDLNLQLVLHQAMQGKRGAALVVNVPSGEVLAMVSLPAYDPNRLNEIGILLEQNPDSTRVMNRVIDGQYQPGGALQTLWMSALLARGVDPQSLVSSASVTLAEESLQLECAQAPETVEIPLQEAYWRGCPAPFLPALTIATVEDSLAAAGFWAVPQLDGFLMDDPPLAPSILTDDNLAAAIAGQGDLTLTPLQMIQIIAAVVNDGNGVPLHIVAATRYPAEAPWQPVDSNTVPLAIMQASIAQQIKGILEMQPWGTEIYGHISQAWAGSREYAWFLGWTPLEDGTYAALVVVLEEQKGEISPLAVEEIAVPVLEAVQQP